MAIETRRCPIKATRTMKTTPIASAIGAGLNVLWNQSCMKYTVVAAPRATSRETISVRCRSLAKSMALAHYQFDGVEQFVRRCRLDDPARSAGCLGFQLSRLLRLGG